MRVRYTPRALSDLQEIYSYIDEFNPRAALAVKHRIQERIRRLADHPYMGRRSDRRADLRIKPVVRHPYLIVYSLAGDEGTNPSHSSQCAAPALGRRR
jgi:addiction module RelE/StbE family toxin